MNFPFKERVISEGVVERTFSSGTDSDELIWHRDREDRRLLVVESGGWQFQMDNSLPVNLEPGQELLVPAGAWHRVIRGNNDLKIIINKGQQVVAEGIEMKLTKARLKQIIKEEKRKLLREQYGDEYDNALEEVEQELRNVIALALDKKLSIYDIDNAWANAKKYVEEAMG